jgi:hypothetical protein
MKESSEQELAAVMALPAAERYLYFVRWVADAEELWTLRNDEGFFFDSDDERREILPVWPHRRCAELCNQGTSDEAYPFKIDLDRWLAAWTTGLEIEGRLIGVFPVPGNQGIVVSPGKLAEDLSTGADR